MKSILVPIDFSKAAEKALEHAIVMGKKTKAKIILLNLCSKLEIDNSKEKLELLIKNVEYTIEPLVRVGKFEDIGKISKELDIDIIFMGTHGSKGIQRIKGSHILKVVTKSETPCIIVQEGSITPVSYDKLIATTSFHFENKQKIKVVSMIAKYFNSEVVIIYNDVDPLMKSKSLKNVKFMQNHLKKEGVKYSIEISNDKDYNSDTIKLGSKIGANLIAIMNMQKDDILGSTILGKKYEQKLIMNDGKIPILILNPKSNNFGSTSSGFH